MHKGYVRVNTRQNQIKVCFSTLVFAARCIQCLIPGADILHFPLLLNHVTVTNIYCVLKLFVVVCEGHLHVSH